MKGTSFHVNGVLCTLLGMIMNTDNIVIGAGYAGLATAALLAKQGKDVILLEKHSAIGGCASFFRRMGIHLMLGQQHLVVFARINHSEDYSKN